MKTTYTFTPKPDAFNQPDPQGLIAKLRGNLEAFKLAGVITRTQNVNYTLVVDHSNPRPSEADIIACLFAQGRKELFTITAELGE